MQMKSIILCVLLSVFSGQSHSHILEKVSTNIDCANICAASEGQAEFDAETELCKCLLSKHFDDVDLALLNKNAVLTQNTANNIRPYREKNISKREADETTDLTTNPPVPIVAQSLDETPEVPLPITEAIMITTTAPPEDKTEIDFNPDTIVGQAPANRRTNQRLVTPRRQRDPRPISLDQQRLISQQMSDHLNRLNQQSDQRLRDVEIQAIKSNLRQLSNTVLVQTPQQRSRMRNVVEEARRRPVRPRLLHSRIVGAPFPNFENRNETQEEVGGAIKEIFHGKRRHEIITQDPRLIDD